MRGLDALSLLNTPAPKIYMAFLGALAELDASLSRHLCSGVVEGFPVADPARRTFAEWMAHYEGGMPTLPETYAMLRDLTDCRVFTWSMEKNWGVLCFEVREAKRYGKFLVYPWQDRLVVEFAALDGTAHYHRFTDVRDFIVAVRAWFWAGPGELD